GSHHALVEPIGRIFEVPYYDAGLCHTFAALFNPACVPGFLGSPLQKSGGLCEKWKIKRVNSTHSSAWG
ncbi:MAG TPA: hypothetical protein PK971_09350, partial [Saprospiraceae bacterium]|nr:hypothetical protein [Saprospiraceae bacterium]